MSFCQTVLPGNEAMLIPTSVTDYATLAVPDTNYWCGTAAHYYINPPGVGTDTACVWGTHANPFGNWSPYVAGANVDKSGNTFIKLGWNPIYLEPTTPFRNNMPNWGVKVDCPNGGCHGLPCSIDPSQNSVNQMVGSASDGAGGGAFCVVTVDQGATANFVVFNSGGDQSDKTTNGGGSGSSSTGWNRGGQFYQSTSSAAASASPSTSSSTSSTSESTTSTAWTSSSSSTTSSTQVPTSSSATSTWHSRAPTHSPYYSMFNQTTSTGSVGHSSVEATATPAGPSSSSQPSILSATGAASSIQVSVVGLLSALAFYAVAAL